ncbi:hypothetical protein CLOM_g22190 [Closterium sp. NIES-68]|nr:hypothetical protein CLOM_g22190 [Closterium sp. NIES-68]GJP86232.1 hypothetical protein CLOP_g16281 [Closterium sp. NIES-67]
MVLWELTLATAYFLGLKRTYRLALRMQRKVLVSRPGIRDFAKRRTRAVFGVALTAVETIQHRDIQIGRSVGNFLLRFLDRMKPSAHIRGDAPVQGGAGVNSIHAPMPGSAGVNSSHAPMPGSAGVNSSHASVPGETAGGGGLSSNHGVGGSHATGAAAGQHGSVSTSSSSSSGSGVTSSSSSRSFSTIAGLGASSRASSSSSSSRASSSSSSSSGSIHGWERKHVHTHAFAPIQTPSSLSAHLASTALLQSSTSLRGLMLPSRGTQILSHGCLAAVQTFPRPPSMAPLYLQPRSSQTSLLSSQFATPSSSNLPSATGAAPGAAAAFTCLPRIVQSLLAPGSM